jgi:hypothetical protein
VDAGDLQRPAVQEADRSDWDAAGRQGPGQRLRGAVERREDQARHVAELWIYDELAQSQKRELLDTLSTSQGGRSEPLGIVISTQSALTNHPLSELIDYGEQVNTGVHDDATFVCRVYASPEGCDLMDKRSLAGRIRRSASFRDETDLETLAKRAHADAELRKRVPEFVPQPAGRRRRAGNQPGRLGSLRRLASSLTT